MSGDTQQILDAAMALSERDRAELAARLITSLDPAETDPGWAAAWDDEIERRLKELDSGRVATVPWSEARRQIAGAGGTNAAAQD